RTDQHERPSPGQGGRRFQRVAPAIAGGDRAGRRLLFPGDRALDDGRRGTPDMGGLAVARCRRQQRRLPRSQDLFAVLWRLSTNRRRLNEYRRETWGDGKSYRPADTSQEP